MASPPIFIASFLAAAVLMGFKAYSNRTMLGNWKDPVCTKFVWRNRYDSFEDLRALFDRGDVMVSAVLIASSLQLSHPVLSRALRGHRTDKADPWCRIIRTVALLYIIVRSNSRQRLQVMAWLQRLQHSMPWRRFEHNVLAYATVAYGLIKTYEFLGAVTTEQENEIVKGVYVMADKTDPRDNGRKVPNTMAEVERCLQKHLPLHVDGLLDIHMELLQRCNNVDEERKQEVGISFGRLWTTMRFLMLKAYIRKLSYSVLAQGFCQQYLFEKLFWWLLKKVHCFFMYFHYIVCPRALTFDGTLDLILSANPHLKAVMAELSHEIFGSKEDSSIADWTNNICSRHFSNVEACFPRMDTGKRSTVTQLYEAIVEHIRCSYYRRALSCATGQLPQHLGIIMDGNRRYARSRGMDGIINGHLAGAHKLLQVISWTFSSGIQNLTVWALSSDNLKRGPQELEPLFSLMAEHICEMTMGNTSYSIPEVRFRVIGNRSMLPNPLVDIISKAEAATAGNTKFNLQIAMAYGGRSEITHAMKLAVNAKVESEGLLPENAIEKISEADVSRQIYSAQMVLPQIDAILRTSGENRLSGFALWESQHAEFAIVEENWPALRQSSFFESILDLSKRNRRLGA